MESKNENLLWAAGRGTEYSKGKWIEIIDELLDGFEDYLGMPFERDKDMLVESDCPNPQFSRWFWGTFNSGLELEFSAVMAGSTVSADNFVVSVSLFLFCRKRRVFVADNGHYLGFSFQAQTGKPGSWICHGWMEDIYGEWESLTFKGVE